MKTSLKASLLALLAAGGLAVAGEPSVSSKIESKNLSTGEAPDGEAKECLDLCGYQGPRVWASSDYLLWKIKDAPIPTPMLATSFTGGPPVLGSPGAAIAYGAQSQTFDWFNGGRVALGGWLDRQGRFGLEGSGFLLESRSATFSRFSDGDPRLGIPNRDQLLPGDPFGNGSVPLADPGFLRSGDATISSSAQLWGAEANMIASIARNDRFELRGLAGFRFLDLQESLGTRYVATEPLGLIYDSNDFFGTQNRFYGGQFGGQGRFNLGRFFLDATLKVALGSTVERITVDGYTINSIGLVLDEGFYARDSNIGVSRQTRFAVVPEVGLKAGAKLTDNVSVWVGYTFLYWSDVARPGEQVDPRRTVFGPGGPYPQRLNATSDLFIQGLNFGGEIRF